MPDGMSRERLLEIVDAVEQSDDFSMSNWSACIHGQAYRRRLTERVWDLPMSLTQPFNPFALTTRNKEWAADTVRLYAKTGVVWWEAAYLNQRPVVAAVCVAFMCAIAPIVNGLFGGLA